MSDSGINQEDISQWLMLAASSIVPGNLTILGAVSNIIILEVAKSRKVRGFTFTEFFKVGSIAMFVNVAVYFLFLMLV